MITGIKIEFNENCHQYFESEWNNDIEAEILVISLLETINDICEEHKLNTKEQLMKYIKIGSIDKYLTAEERRKFEELRGEEDVKDE